MATAETATGQGAGGLKGFIARAMAREGVAHLIRAAKRFSMRLGSEFAAAITYFSFLALVPILMLSFSVAGYVLTSRPDLLQELRNGIANQIPGKSLADLINNVLNEAIGARLSVGLIGLLTALYTGIGWMGNLRAAVQAQWRVNFDTDQEIAKEKIWVTWGKNLLALVGLGLAILVSMVLSTAGANLVDPILGWLGLQDVTILKPVLTVLPILLAMAADVLIFTWVFRMLAPSDQLAPRRALLRGAVIAAVSFEILKMALNIFMPMMTKSPSAAIFGPVIGLLLFMNLTATMVLFVAAWIATAPGGPNDRVHLQKAEPGPEPAPVNSGDPGAPAEVASDGVGGPKLWSLLGVGMLVGWSAARRRRR